MPFIANFVCSKQHNYMVKIGTTLSPLGKKAVLCGSGELGKEVAIELQRYGIEVVALDRYANAPAMQVAHRSYVLSMLDGAQLRAVIEKEKPDYIIPEIEAIATDMLLELEKEGYNVIPTARATRLTMNREGIRRLAAEELGIYYNTGEGGLHRDFYKYGANTIVQVASGRFGIEERCLNAGAAIEIKMGQGAKPGIGGHLPGAKIVGDVSKTRMIPEGSDAISPAPHHDIYSIEDLRQLVFSLKEATNYEKPVIVKIAAFFYKLPLGSMKLLGDEGFAHFMVAYNIYSFFLTLATAGFPVALSRMISEADTLDRPAQVQRIFRTAAGTLAAIGGFFTLLMLLFNRQLAVMMGNADAAPSILALAPAVVIVCLTSAYRGYCQGRGNMIPTAFGQVIEEVGKLVVGLTLAFLLIRAHKPTGCVVRDAETFRPFYKEFLEIKKTQPANFRG